MYKNKCRFCNKELEFEKQQQFASHSAVCIENPNFLKRMINVKEFHENRELNNRIYTKCKNCNIDIITKAYRLKKSKSGNSFCNLSCAATYNNTHKTSGTRRSKLEFWIEEELKKIYEFEIIFNDKKRINSELDISIPALNLAFELNGIFHYEPIYGDEKLKKIENNDNRKYQACLENKIELCILDTSSSKKFKPERDIKYLNIIKSIIENKIK
jgi:hypothetical protein